MIEERSFVGDRVDVETGTDSDGNEPKQQSRWERVGARAVEAREWVVAQARATRGWARQQPPRQLVTVALSAIAALAVAWLVLWAVISMIRWLFTPDTPPSPAPSPKPEMPPGWLVEMQHAGLWERVYGTVADYADGASTAAGTPGWLLLALWGGTGVVVLVGSWFSWRHPRSLASAVAWTAWLAATCWVIAVSTPGGNLVPAGIVAALGILISIQPWTVLVVASLIVLGTIPT